MSLKPGARLGPYAIVARLGAGGMGEVWQATDTRLDRQVAVKILPPGFAKDKTFRARFEREARTISALSHPHICTLFDVGREGDTDYLVMELIEGETLSTRLGRGPLPFSEVLRFGVQIAKALEAAHQKGIVHRDLKPANVMLTKSGAKLLDFGLARIADSKTPSTTATALAGELTRTGGVGPPLTQEGTILGTFQYMAPEQLEGREAGPRTDIFAFGALLYEMATGKRAFEGESHPNLIAAIVSSDPPPVSSVAEMTPAAFDHVVRTCLEKDPDDRWQSASDIAKQLRWIDDSGSEAGVAPSVAARPLIWRRTLVALAVSGWFVVAALGLWLVLNHSPDSPPSMRQFRVRLPDPQIIPLRKEQYALDLATDGSMLTYSAEMSGQRRIFVWRFSQLEPEYLSNTEGGYGPFFSPDGEWLAFFTADELLKVRVSGGAPVRVCNVRGGLNGSWDSEGYITFGIAGSYALNRVSSEGGPVEILKELNLANEYDHDYGDVLPGGGAIVYAIFPTTGMSWDEGQIVAQDLTTGERNLLVENGTFPKFSPTNHLLYCRNSVLYAVPFDAGAVKVLGPERPVREGVLSEAGSGFAYYDVSENGHLVYIPGTGLSRRTIVAVDQHGKLETLIDEAKEYKFLNLSSDGHRLAVIVGAGSTNELRVYDLRSNLPPIVLPTPGRSCWPVWSPDDEWIAFGDLSAGRPRLSRISTGPGRWTVEPLISTDFPTWPYAWNVQGNEVLYAEPHPETNWDIWAVSLKDPEERRPLVQSEYADDNAALSPDGMLLAYVSNETGLQEVHVKLYPDGPMQRISSGGGIQPRWRTDGESTALFYRRGNSMMRVPIAGGPDFTPGTPQELFEIEGWAGEVWETTYDILPDGRFILAVENNKQTLTANEIIVVLNWAQELKRLAPHPEAY